MSGTGSAALLALLDRARSLHPRDIDLKLDRVERLLARLGFDETALPPVIHVAGTNGKGSTLAMIRAGLEASVGPCHLYTSPHLVRFHERIRVSGSEIGETALVALLEEVLAANAGGPITFFEVSTVAALIAFARAPAAFTLLEVGLGGRGDATNVIAKPRICAITPVSFDHQEYLGTTLAEIAGEKAGILKPGVPCVVAPQDAEAAETIARRAAEIEAPLLRHGQDWQVWEERARLVFQDLDGLADLPLPCLPGPHQLINAGTALAVLRALGAGEAALEAAMTGATWPARMQRLRDHPLADLAPGAEIWLDGGHNPAAGEALAATLAGLPARPTVLVCGMLPRKDAAGFLMPLARVAEEICVVPTPEGGDEAAHLARLVALSRDLGMRASAAASTPEAIRRLTVRHPNVRILICGSLYLAGAVLDLLPAP